MERQLLLVGSKQARLKQEEATESARQKSLQKELEWARQSRRHVGRKARPSGALSNEMS